MLVYLNLIFTIFNKSMTISSLVSIPKLLVVIACLFLFYAVMPVQAQIPSNLELDGYAWSENIGWISLNCRTGSASGGSICGTSNYKVSVDPTNRNLVGYAWSPNIGWIRFNSLTGFPSGGGTTGASSRLSNSDYANTSLVGWVRACAGTASSAGNCGSSSTNTASGGWDGWISLNGSNYQVRTVNGVFVPHSSLANRISGVSTNRDGFVWGSTVVGWVDMATRVSFYLPATISATNCTITTAGQGTCTGRLTWSMGGNVTNPYVVRTSPLTTISQNRSGTNHNVTLNLGNNTYAVRNGQSGSNIVTAVGVASCGGGLIPSDNVCVTPPPVAVVIRNLVATPEIVRRGNGTRVTWDLSHPPVAGQCILSGPGFTNIDIAGLSNYDIPTLTSTARITLNCDGGAEQSVTVVVVPAFNEI